MTMHFWLNFIGAFFIVLAALGMIGAALHARWMWKNGK